VHARVSEGVVLGDRQRVDVGAQANGTARVAVLDDADHPGLAQSPMHRNAPGGECPGDQVRGPLLLKPKLGMGMNVPPQGLDGRYLGQDWLKQFHVAGRIAVAIIQLSGRHRVAVCFTAPYGPRPETRAPNTARI
jgi:hypothetical protein